MKLELSQKLQQQQILAPQMILSMDILLLTAADLQQRIEQEFMENPALEFTDRPPQDTNKDAPPESPSADANKSEFSTVDTFGEFGQSTFEHFSSRQARKQASDNKLETLQNTEGKPPGLKDYLMQQLRLQVASEQVRDLGETIVNSLDQRGYLVSPSDEIYSGLADSCTREQFEFALNAVRSLDPPGVGAEDLKQCLLLQLERDSQIYPLETQIIAHHLEDLGNNKLPKIAKDLNTTLDDLKEALEIILALDPLPGARYESSSTIYIRPDVVVEEVDGNLEVALEDSDLPRLTVSPECRQLLKKSRDNRDTSSFLRKKIESAQWLIQAVEQRQRTLRDIAVAMVDYQRDFMMKGPEFLRAMKMQTLADNVGVHISTVSRAIKGKYVQTPWGLFALRHFFTGGVGHADGEVESRRNVYRWIGEIVEREDKGRPYSDTDIAKILQDEQSLKIARRTVTKYREAQKIPSSRLRKCY